MRRNNTSQFTTQPLRQLNWSLSHSAQPHQTLISLTLSLFLSLSVQVVFGISFYFYFFCDGGSGWGLLREGRGPRATSHRRGEGSGMQGLRDCRVREASGAYAHHFYTQHTMWHNANKRQRDQIFKTLCDNREHSFHLLACIVCFFLCFFFFLSFGLVNLARRDLDPRLLAWLKN